MRHLSRRVRHSPTLCLGPDQRDLSKHPNPTESLSISLSKSRTQTHKSPLASTPPPEIRLIAAHAHRPQPSSAPMPPCARCMVHSPCPPQMPFSAPLFSNTPLPTLTQPLTPRSLAPSLRSRREVVPRRGGQRRRVQQRPIPPPPLDPHRRFTVCILKAR